MRWLIFIFLLGPISSLAATKKVNKKEVTVILKCVAGACTDMSADNTCSAGWVVNADEVPPIAAVGNLPECKCTPNACVPNEAIKAVGFFENDPSFPSDMNVKRFKNNVVLKK